MVKWIDRIWLGILVFLVFFSPLVMLRSNGEVIIHQLDPLLKTTYHTSPTFTNLVFKEVFCQALILVLFYLTLLKKALIGNWKFTRSPLDIPIFTFLIISAISLSFSRTLNISFRDWGLLATFVLFYYMILDQLKDGKKIRLVLWSVVASACVTALFATCQHLEITLWGFLVKAQEARNRMSGTIGHNNGVASYLMMATFTLLALRFGKEPKTYKFRETGKIMVWQFIQIGLLIWFLFVILATLSRGVWIGTTLGSVLLLYYFSKEYGIGEFIKRYKFKFILGIVLGIVFIGILSIPSPLNPWGVSVIQRFKDTVLRKETYLQDDRIRMWASSFEMIRENPLTGVGLGAFKYWIPVYQGKFFERHPDSKLEPTYKLTNQSHNEYIQSWTELGVFGFLVALWLVFKYLKEGVTIFQGIWPKNTSLEFRVQSSELNESKLQTRNSKLTEGLPSSFFLALFCATAGVLCQSLVDFPLHVAPLALLFILLGALVINRTNIHLEENLTQNSKLKTQNYFWLIGLPIVCIVTLFPLGVELQSDWYYNRMNYFLEASEDLKGVRLQELSRKSLLEAVSYGKKSIALDPHNGRTRYYLGLAYMKLQNIELAIDEFESALRDFQYADLHFNLADSYEWARRKFNATQEPMKEQFVIKKAIEHYRMAASIYPLNRKLAEEARRNHQFYMPSEALHRVGVLLYQQGKTDEALAVWRRIARIDPEYLNDKYYQIAKQYRWQNDYKTAIQILQQAYALDSTNPQSISQLGGMYFMAGQYKEVLPYLDKLYETNSQDTNVYYAYALVYEKLNEKQKALEWAKKTLAIDSTNQFALQLLDRLEKPTRKQPN